MRRPGATARDEVEAALPAPPHPSISSPALPQDYATPVGMRTSKLSLAAKSSVWPLPALLKTAIVIFDEATSAL